jgi:hypothetical protein
LLVKARNCAELRRSGASHTDDGATNKLRVRRDRARDEAARASRCTGCCGAVANPARTPVSCGDDEVASFLHLDADRAERSRVDLDARARGICQRLCNLNGRVI